MAARRQYRGTFGDAQAACGCAVPCGRAWELAQLQLTVREIGGIRLLRTSSVGLRVAGAHPTFVCMSAAVDLRGDDDRKSEGPKFSCLYPQSERRRAP